jgi:hypothetical protein
MRQIRRHTWLFSFTDIAFLLLLVFTQLAQVKSSAAPVAEMRLPAPVVVENPELKVLKTEKDYRQLLVEKHSGKPYRLARITGSVVDSNGKPLVNGVVVLMQPANGPTASGGSQDGRMNLLPADRERAIAAWVIIPRALTATCNRGTT